ncbi:zinc finger protein 431-like isoform X1 [Pieris napi]|uniref:zinc finger protein 431-like isoform X1 n=1 Tax=Pieris napi TaxID=78633 RepID=UPI001FBAD185|nr:zinc finger protein 431-like isoform X1 [Pieris napi]
MSICYNGYNESPNTSGPEVTISGANYIQENSFSFEKIAQVCLERINISKYVKSLEANIETSNNDIPNAENKDKLAEFTRNCSVRLVRNDLNALRDLLFKNLHNLKCDICDKVYTSEKKLKKHKENKHLLVHDEKSLKRVSFSDKVIVHEINEYHRCRKCSKIFELYSTLKVHMRREHKKRKCYICYYCTKKFVDRMFFKVHIKLHCDVCGCFMANKHKLMEHKHNVCKMVQEYKCKRCEDIYYSLLALQDHMSSHGTAFVCDICKEQFESKCRLAYHIKFLHSKYLMDLYTFNLGTYQCNFCNESAVEQDIIEKHVLHLTELNKSRSQRKFTCDHCIAKFLSEAELFKHKLTHNLDLPEKGPNCKSKIEFKFKVGDPLPDHFKPEVVLNRIQIPEEVADEPLDYIEIPNGLDVDLKKALIDPISKKTLLSKYQCTICTRYLSNSYGLKRHMATVHKDTVQNTDDLKCYTCEEVFAWPSLLHTHNCIRNNIPDPPFSDARPEIELQESDDYFEIPPPIVELTVYDECVIRPGKMCNSGSYTIVMEEVPIEF